MMKKYFIKIKDMETIRNHESMLLNQYETEKKIYGEEYEPENEEVQDILFAQ